jgi:hypothetical protein
VRVPARIILVAWGESYLADILELTLPALLAPGNLDIVTARYDCELCVVTERRFFESLQSSAVGRRLAALCPVRTIALDDLLGGCSYGMSLTYALHRGFADLGERMTEYRLFFLNADFVLSEGSYRVVADRLDGGDRLVFAPSYCVVAESAAPLLVQKRGDEGAPLVVSKREMARIALDNLHDTVLAKTLNRPGIRPKVFDQFYWRVDGNTLIGNQMPIALVAMRPERAYLHPVCFWDYGVSSEACPSAPRCVLGDSDDFLMLELRARAYYRSELGAESSAPQDIARVLGGFMTRDQIELGAAPVALHAGAVPRETEDGRAALDRFRSEVYRLLPASPVDHRGHPYWTRHEARFAAERARLAGREGVPASPRNGVVGRLYAAVFGRVPCVTIVHPLWATVRRFSRCLAAMGSVERGLWIRSGPASLFPFRDRAGWCEISAATVFKYGAPPDIARAQLCVCDLSWDDFQHFPALAAALGGRVPILAFVCDGGIRHVHEDAVARIAYGVRPARPVRVLPAGSRIAVWTHDLFRAVIGAVHGAGLWRTVVLAVAMAALVPVALLAAACELLPSRLRRRTSVTVAFEPERDGGEA